ncbi:hypothetical protein Btru_042187 [Bulinus truncatus]|nr:hypothetical protein Btru_042187 [Bulinus truncatus]
MSEALMPQSEMARLSVWNLVLLMVMMSAFCIADDLMMEEESADSKLELVFLIHTSSKMNKINFQHYTDFMKGVVEKTNMDSGRAKFAAVTYRKNAKVAFNLNKFKTKYAVAKGIGEIKGSKSKIGNLTSGLNIIKTKLFNQKKTPPNTIRWVIIVTDANSGVDVDRISSSAKQLTDVGVNILAYGIGLNDLSQLKSVTPQVRGLGSYSELGNATKEVVRILDTMQLRDEEAIRDLRSFVKGKADIAIVYHLSNAIKPPEIKNFVQFLKSLLEKANIDTGDVKIAFMNYAKRGRHQFEFTKLKSKADVFTYLDKIGPGYRAAASNAGVALKEVQTKLFTKKAGERPDAPNVILLITDIKNSEQTELMLQVAEELKTKDAVKIITVGMKAADASELKTVASQPQEKNAFFAQSYDSVISPGFIESIWRVVDPAAAVPALPPTSTPVRTTTRRVTTESVTETKIKDGDSKADIVFAVHFDLRKTEEEFQQLKDFLTNLVSTSDVDGGNVRFGLYFSANQFIFNLNDHKSRNTISDAIKALPKSTAKAERLDLGVVLRDVRTRMFDQRKGDRPDVQNKIIIFTDTVTSGPDNLLTREKRLAETSSISVYGAGIGLDDKEKLVQMSSENNVVTFSGYSELRSHGNHLRRLIPALQGIEEVPLATTPRKEDY